MIRGIHPLSIRDRLGFDPQEAVAEAVGKGIIPAATAPKPPERTTPVAAARLRLGRELWLKAAEEDPDLTRNPDWQIALQAIRKLTNKL